MTEPSQPGPLPPPDAVCDGGDLDCGSGLLLIIRNAMQPLDAGRPRVRAPHRTARADDAALEVQEAGRADADSGDLYILLLFNTCIYFEQKKET